MSDLHILRVEENGVQTDIVHGEFQIHVLAYGPVHNVSGVLVQMADRTPVSISGVSAVRTSETIGMPTHCRLSLDATAAKGALEVLVFSASGSQATTQLYKASLGSAA